MSRLIASKWLIWALALLAAIAYGGFAAIQHAHFRTGFDLAIFDQSVWHYANLDPPASSIKGLSSILGDHFSPLVAALAPLYWIWADPRALLFAQGALIAASIVPVFAFAERRIGRVPAYLVAVSYAIFWGVQTGATFEFHEVAFAPLLIALAIYWSDGERWGRFAVCVGLLLLVKEDLSLFVAAFGIYLLTLRRFRVGALTLAAGIGWYLLATKALIPHYAPAGRGFTYWSYGHFGDDLGDSLLKVAGSPWLIPQVMFDHHEKTSTIVYLFAPFLFLTLFSRLAILTLPLIAERFLSDNPTFWGTHFHYSLAIAPILAMGAAAGLANLSRMPRVAHRFPAPATWGATLMLPAGLWFGHLAHAFPLVNLAKPGFYRAPDFSAVVEGGLALIPPQASVSAQDFLLPHLTHRDAVSEITPEAPLSRYVMGSLVRRIGAPTGNPGWAGFDRVLRGRLPAYRRIYSRDGWLVLELRRTGRRLR